MFVTTTSTLPISYGLTTVVNMLSRIVILIRSGGMRLYRAIFIIYAYDRIMHDRGRGC